MRKGNGLGETGAGELAGSTRIASSDRGNDFGMGIRGSEKAWVLRRRVRRSCRISRNSILGIEAVLCCEDLDRTPSCSRDCLWTCLKLCRKSQIVLIRPG